MTDYNYGDEFSSVIAEKSESDILLSSIFCQSIGSLTSDGETQFGSDDLKMFEKSEFIYPNPANTYLWISNNEESPYSAIAIYDMQGRLIENKAIATDQKNWIEVDVQNIPSGMYIIQGLDAQGNKLANFSFIKE